MRSRTGWTLFSFNNIQHVAISHILIHVCMYMHAHSGCASLHPESELGKLVRNAGGVLPLGGDS